MSFGQPSCSDDCDPEPVAAPRVIPVLWKTGQSCESYCCRHKQSLPECRSQQSVKRWHAACVRTTPCNSEIKETVAHDTIDDVTHNATSCRIGIVLYLRTANPAQSASPNEMQGGLTAYQFAGLYKGSSRPIVANDESCRPSQEVALEVRHGQLKLVWHEPQVFDARIMDDGRFFATTASMVQAEKHVTIVPTLQGQIRGGDLVADYGTRWCRYRLVASQSPAEQHLSERADGAGTRQ
jgi:hypothetical protein